MPADIAVMPVVRAEESTLGTLSKASWRPELSALVAVRAQPLGGDIVILSKRSREIFDLDELTNECGSRIEIAGFEESHSADAEFPADLGDGGDAHDPLIAKGRPTLSTEERTVHPEQMPKSCKPTGRHVADRSTPDFSSRVIGEFLKSATNLLTFGAHANNLWLRRA
jgi:hypothetical protein